MGEHHPGVSGRAIDEPTRSAQEEQQRPWQPVLFDGVACPYAPVEIFRDREAAKDHLGKHVLGPNEAEAWALVVPLILEIGDITEPSQRNRLYQYLQTGRDQVFERLYELYARSIVLNLEDACQLGWKNVRCRKGGGWVGVAFGTSGLLIVAEDGVIKTAFLAGQDRERNNASSVHRHIRPEERRRRRIRRGYRKKVPPPRESKWSEAERLYYRVFRPALQFVRRCVYEWAPDTDGTASRRSDYWLVKDLLPTTRSVPFEKWAEWRQRCRGTTYAPDVN